MRRLSSPDRRRCSRVREHVVMRGGGFSSFTTGSRRRLPHPRVHARSSGLAEHPDLGGTRSDASALSKLNIRVALEATPMAIEGSEMNNPNS